MSRYHAWLALSASALLTIAGCGGGGDAGGSATGDAPATDTAAAALKAIDPATTATVKVSVKYAGADVQNKKIKMSADATCAAAHEADALEEKFVKNANGTMANCFVYVKKGVEEYKVPAASGKVSVDQIGCVYKPHVVGLQLKQELEYVNSDDTLHNVHPTPKSNKEFNVAMPFKGGKNTDIKFTKEEIGIPVKCNVHPWMTGYVNVVKHPFFGVTPTGDGAVTIGGLPPGTHTLEVWHEDLGTQTVEVTLGAKETKEISVELKAKG